ncbi:MAG TPA: alpha-amylase family glycosyl hydrolase [Thermoanaerobaculia bacterium]|nr:alpha-amylase family glycosyl hydrolase [Thermoanaerobaculia bacterium]
MTSPHRRRPIGAELTAEGVDFRVWAPDHRDVAVVIDDRDHPLDREEHGYFRGIVRGDRAGTRYRFRLDRGDAFPDPASRFQPDGPHGASEVVDRHRYEWREGNPRIDRRVIYEMHIGTFTREGTWRAAAQHLAPLAAIGINTLEVMPVHEFPRRFGWGYDGVDLWAPTRLYGSPDDFRAFVDAAHASGLAVILDVVYNHFAPDGCYVGQFTKSYFTDRYKNEWGDAINFDGPHCEGVREFFSQNAAYWIDEFHLDGLRLDATQSINDSSPEHIVSVIARCARDAADDRDIFIVAENEPQDVALIRKLGVDAMWNDDWHHSAMIAAGKPREAYYTDYKGAPQEFVSMARHGFLYQGQWYAWQKKRRGTPSLDTPPERLVCYLQNHDQVANSQDGRRLHQVTSDGKYRALTALLLLGPDTPMLFQGEEFATAAPFLYFADHKPELAKAVAKGRSEFLTQFPSIETTRLDAPHDIATFEKCKLEHAEATPLIRELLRLRREISGHVDGAVLGDDAFVLRYSDDHLLIVNLGRALELDIAPEPLLAPPPNSRWQMEWSSDGTKQIEFEAAPSWRIPAECAVLLRTVGYTRS